MSPGIDVITLGVTDSEQARDFYGGALGATVCRDEQVLDVSLGSSASCVGLRGWEEVANGAGVPSRSGGFRAFALSFILESAAEVDQVLRGAEEHGGWVSKPPENAVWGYSAYVTDPDGYLGRSPLRGAARCWVASGPDRATGTPSSRRRFRSASGWRT